MKKKLGIWLLVLMMSAFFFVGCSVVDGSSSRDCSACKATGYCDRCAGYGEVNGYTCNDCYGDGKCVECGGRGYKK